MQSKSIGQCLCDAGWTGNASDGCNPCVEGTYKSVSGSDVCAQCDVGTFLPRQGSTSQRQCLTCHPFSSSTQGSQNQSACLCNKGYTALGFDNATYHETYDASAAHVFSCHPCPADHYKDSIGQDKCTRCLPASSSEPGSTDVTMCQCSKGYTSIPGQLCEACAGGHFKASRGFGLCTVCKAGTYSSTIAAVSEATCIACPSDKTSLPGSTFMSDCVCPPGNTLPMAYNVCVPCAPGTFKEEIGNHNCSLCAFGKYSGVRGSTSGARCASCLPGAATLGPGATNAVNCTCDKGYTGLALGINCTACLANEYKATYGSAACTRCRDFSLSPPASVSDSVCECLFGYVETNGSCIFQCPMGFYVDKAGYGCEICPATTFQPQFLALNSSFCLSCGPGSFSEPGSPSFDDCFCAAGYTGYPVHPTLGCSRGLCDITSTPAPIEDRYTGGCGSACRGAGAAKDCEACPQNHFKEGLVALTCSACPRHSQSHAATRFEIPKFGDDGCMCDPGFTGGLNATCCFKHTSYSAENIGRCFTVTLPGAPSHLGSRRSFPDWNGEDLECVLQRRQQTDLWEHVLNESYAHARNTSSNIASNSSTWPRDAKGLRFFNRDQVLLDSASLQLVCVRCAPGSYKPNNGSAPCLLCPNTTYGLANQVIHTHTHTYTHTHTHTRTHAHTHTRTDIHTYICIHTYIHLHTYIYIHTYIHTYVYTYIYTHTHKYIYVRLFRWEGKTSWTGCRQRFKPSSQPRRRATSSPPRIQRRVLRLYVKWPSTRE